MKKIVKCILPIISSAALAAPVMVSCGQTYKALPNDAFLWEDNQTTLRLLNSIFPDLDKYDTIQIRSHVKKVLMGAISGFNLPNIKNLIIEKTQESLTLESPCFGYMLSLEKIIFKNTNYDRVNGAFTGTFSSLKVLDYSAVDNTSQNNITPYIFSSFPYTVQSIPSGGTIYIKKGVNKDDIEELFRVKENDTTFYGWEVKYK